MPEGPEIRRAADKLAAAIVDRPTTEIFFAFDHLKKYEETLTGVSVTAVETYGKAMVTRFENGLNIYSHNQLYGKWMIRNAHDMPDTNRQLRLAIHNEACSALLYSASEIEVLHDGEVDEHPFIKKLGPDLMHQSTTADVAVERFKNEQFQRRKLTTLLLDQGFLAGVGNYLRTEILFVARVHPDQRPMDCTDSQLAALGTSAVKLARRSYETGGITTDPHLAEKLKAKGKSRRDYRFWVFGREDRPCYVCGTPIIKDSAGGRRLYYCPDCQEK